MIVIDKNIWNAWKLNIIEQILNKMPKGPVYYKIKKLHLLID